MMEVRVVICGGGVIARVRQLQENSSYMDLNDE